MNAANTSELPKQHLARFVVEMIEGLDLGAMSASYRGSGSAASHPRALHANLCETYRSDLEAAA